MQGWLHFCLCHSKTLLPIRMATDQKFFPMAQGSVRAIAVLVYSVHPHAALLHTVRVPAQYGYQADSPGPPRGVPGSSQQYLFSRNSTRPSAREVQGCRGITEQPFARRLRRVLPGPLENTDPLDASRLHMHLHAD